MVSSIRLQSLPRLLTIGIFITSFGSSPAVAEKLQPAQEKRQPRTDRYGDPLPPGALARFGTIRLRPGYVLEYLAYLPDQKSFLSVSRGFGRMLVSMWGKTTGELLRRFEVSDFNLRSADLAPDGKTLAASGSNPSSGKPRVLFWEIATGKTTGELTATGGAVNALAFAPGGKMLVTSGIDRTVRLWDVAARTELRRCHGAKDLWFRFAFSADSKVLAALNSRQRTVQLWDVATGRELRAIHSEATSIRGFVLSPDGKNLATAAAEDKTVRLWDVATGKEVRQFRTESPSYVVAFSPDGKTLAAGIGRVEGKLLKPSSIHLWDANTGRELRYLRGHLSTVLTLAFSPNGQQLLSGGADGVLHLWDIATGKDLLPFAEHTGSVFTAAFSPNGHFLATSGPDGTIRLWEPHTSNSARLFETGNQYPIWNIAFVPDGRTLLSYGREGAVRFWDVPEGRQKRMLQVAEQSFPRAFALSPDGRTVAVWPTGAAIRLLDVSTGKEQRSLPGAAGNGRFLHFSPDGTKLASLTFSRPGERGTLQLWDAATGKEQHHWTFAPSGLIAFSPDGQTIFSVMGGISPLPTGRRTCHTWNTATGEDHAFQAEQPGVVSALAFSPDGRMIAWGDSEGTVTLWDVVAEQVRRRLQGHYFYVLSLAFSPDGKTLASGGADTTALLWDVTGMPFDRPTLPLSVDKLQSLWKDLASTDAGKAFDAIGLLSAMPEQVVPLLKRQLRPAPEAADRRQVARLIDDLNSADFAVREKAMEQLRQLGERAEPGLREALQSKPALEARKRIEELLEGVRKAAASPENLRSRRAVEVLEHIGTPEAREVLKTLAGGAATARLTREAKASLKRLDRHHPSRARSAAE